MTYYVAILITRDGGWAETMGDKDKEAVDFEIECWRDNHARGTYKVFRKSWPRVATQRQLNEWAETCEVLLGW